MADKIQSLLDKEEERVAFLKSFYDAGLQQGQDLLPDGELSTVYNAITESFGLDTLTLEEIETYADNNEGEKGDDITFPEFAKKAVTLLKALKAKTA